MPHWLVTPDAAGVWKVAMRLSLGSLKSSPPVSVLNLDRGAGLQPA
jgi:hypothetical protein